MNCQNARDAFPELLDPRTPASALAEARSHLATCRDCQREFASLSQVVHALDSMPAEQPSPRLRSQVYAMIAEEKRLASDPAPEVARSSSPFARPSPFVSVWRWLLTPFAACALLAVGFIAGTRVTPPPAPADESTKRELADLRREMTKMTQVFGYTLLEKQQGPATERLREVLASANADQPNDKVLDALISAVAFDPSVNVRLRALEALYPHANRNIVREGVLAALPREQNPLVQLELIDFVAAARDRQATPILQTLSQNEQANQTVRDAAQRALAQL